MVTMPSNTITWEVVDSGEGKRIIRPGDDEYKYTEDIYKEITQNVDKLIAAVGLAAS